MKKLLILLCGCWLSLNVGAQDVAQRLNLTTEAYPPFNMEARNGSITGISTEIVQAVLARSGVDYTLALLPWNRAYTTALEQPSSGVFSTTRTAEREALFKWVSPITFNRWVLLAAPDSNISLTTLDDAKQYRIGGYRGDAIAQYLAKQGFKLDLVSRDELNAPKLMRKRIDLWATGDLLGAHLAKQQGITGLKSVLVFREMPMGLALHPDTSDGLVDQLNAALKALYEDGTVEAIHRKYQ